MGVLVALSLVVSSLAFADVGPKPAPCNAPDTCRACTVAAGEQDAGCANDATDAGLEVVECSDRSGSYLTSYYCPPGTTVGRCGCSAVEAPLLLGALGLFSVLRRRRARR